MYYERVKETSYFLLCVVYSTSIFYEFRIFFLASVDKYFAVHFIPCFIGNVIRLCLLIFYLVSWTVNIVLFCLFFFWFVY